MKNQNEVKPLPVQESRPDKYSEQRDKERQSIKEDHNERVQKPEETDYSATKIKGLN